MALDNLSSLGADKKNRSGTAAARRVEKKVKFYSKIRDAVIAKVADKPIAKKRKQRRNRKLGKAYDLSVLSDLLPELTASAKPRRSNNFKVNCKSRRKLLVQETKQFGAVLTVLGPDPVAAINQHLGVAFAAQHDDMKEGKEVKPANGPKIRKNGSQKRKNKKLAKLQPMEA